MPSGYACVDVGSHVSDLTMCSRGSGHALLRRRGGPERRARPATRARSLFAEGLLGNHRLRLRVEDDVEDGAGPPLDSPIPAVALAPVARCARAAGTGLQHHALLAVRACGEEPLVPAAVADDLELLLLEVGRAALWRVLADGDPVAAV